MEEAKIVTELSVEEAKKVASREKRRAQMARAREAGKTKRMVAKAHEPIPEAPAVKVKDSEIVWFTEVDYNPNGKVSADFPAYYFDLKELKEDIRALSEQLDDGIYQGKRKRDAEKRLTTLKDRFDKIESGRPKLEGPTKDKVVRSAKDLGERIKDSMFSYDSHWKQTADPHEVAERMVNPCIEVKDECVASFVKQRGFRVENGKISQNDASIVFKVMSKLLGEPSDTDRLRPIRQHGNVI